MVLTLLKRSFQDLRTVPFFKGIRREKVKIWIPISPRGYTWKDHNTFDDMRAKPHRKSETDPTFKFLPSMTFGLPVNLFLCMRFRESLGLLDNSYACIAHFFKSVNLTVRVSCGSRKLPLVYAWTPCRRLMMAHVCSNSTFNAQHSVPRQHLEAICMVMTNGSH